ncbi:MAG: hypothetical protein P8O91_09850 [Luminiphilus sp.]|nr:hypothetical protein [Luminiphilus sp.]
MARLLDLITSGRNRFWRLLSVATVMLVLAACGAREVVVQGNFPKPLMDPLPLTLGVIYTDEFAQHEIFDEAAGRAESDWLVKTGDAQVEFWNTLFSGMFEDVVLIRDHDTLRAHEGTIDAIIIPAVADLQYTIPLHTNIKIYEIWMKYRFKMAAFEDIHGGDNGELTINPEQYFADWTLTAYGKTPTAFLQSDEEAVNLAAVVALRDAGANFATSFARIPDIAAWMSEGLQPPPSEAAESQEATDG